MLEKRTIAIVCICIAAVLLIPARILTFTFLGIFGAATALVIAGIALMAFALGTVAVVRRRRRLSASAQSDSPREKREELETPRAA